MAHSDTKTLVFTKREITGLQEMYESSRSNRSKKMTKERQSKERAKQSREICAKLVVRKGKRIFLDQLLPTDNGGKIKSWECGIFCNTN